MALTSLYTIKRSTFNHLFQWRRLMKSSMCHISLLKIKRSLSLCFKCIGIKSIETCITPLVVLLLWVLMEAVTRRTPHHHPTTIKAHKVSYNHLFEWKWMRCSTMRNSRRLCGSMRNLAPPREWCSSRQVTPALMRASTKEMNLHTVWHLLPRHTNKI